MAGSATTELRVKVGVTGDKNLTRLSRSLSNLGRDTAKANFNFKRFTAVLKEKEQRAVKSVNTTRQFSAAWRELANSVRIGSNEFKIATAEAARLDAQLAKTQARRGGFGNMARGIGAVAGSAVFGGPEGAIGATLGLMGGPGGALVGGAIGAQVGMVRKAAGGIAENVAQFRGYQIALAGISDSQEDFNKSMKGMTEISKQFLIPQKDAIRQFTRLKASITGAGFSTEETIKVFKGMSAAILATGGSTHDLNSALVAAAQVFSKGKVSAEELRQQIGERLPGAFTIFADAMGITTKELDKMLERGEVDLTNFVKFSESIFERYSQIADQLADSPEKAGQRLTLALSMAEIKFGGFFQVVGAGFQDWATDLVNWSLDNEEKLKRNIAEFAVWAEDVVYIMKEVAKTIFNVLKPVFEWMGRTLNALTDQIKEDILEGQYKEMMRSQPGYNKWKDRPLLDLRKEALGNVDARGIPEGSKRSTEFKAEYRKLLMDRLGIAENEAAEIAVLYEDRVNKKLEELFSLPNLQFGTAKGDGSKNKGGGSEDGKTAFDGLKEGIKSFGSTAQDVYTQIKTATENAFKKMEDALVNFVMTGKMNFKDFARSVIADLTRIAVRQAMLNTMSGIPFLKNLLPSAKGNVFAQNGIVPFAKGGIVNSPYIFPFKNGTGIMGEAGPEAIMPLRRGTGGRLGVEASGAGVGNIVVNVDASGSSVEGDSGQAEELGSILGAAIQAEIVNQQRPGGLLA